MRSRLILPEVPVPWVWWWAPAQRRWAPAQSLRCRSGPMERNGRVRMTGPQRWSLVWELWFGIAQPGVLVVESSGWKHLCVVGLTPDVAPRFGNLLLNAQQCAEGSCLVDLHGSSFSDSPLGVLCCFNLSFSILQRCHGGFDSYPFSFIRSHSMASSSCHGVVFHCLGGADCYSGGCTNCLDDGFLRDVLGGISPAISDGLRSLEEVFHLSVNVAYIHPLWLLAVSVSV